MLDNEQRVRAIEQVMDTHRDAIQDFDSDAEKRATDLLTNLRHWCKANDIDFTRSVRISKTHFLEEA